MCDCDDATVLLNIYSYLVFVGECLALVPSHLPHLRELCLDYSCNVRYEYLEELRDALPGLEVSAYDVEHLGTTYISSTSDSDETISQRALPDQS